MLVWHSTSFPVQKEVFSDLSWCSCEGRWQSSQFWHPSNLNLKEKKKNLQCPFKDPHLLWRQRHVSHNHSQKNSAHIPTLEFSIDLSPTTWGAQELLLCYMPSLPIPWWVSDPPEMPTREHFVLFQDWNTSPTRDTMKTGLFPSKPWLCGAGRQRTTHASNQNHNI